MIWLKPVDLLRLGIIKMFNTILVVCTGNICRSPIGERLLQKLLPAKKISSAGVQALKGHDADSAAVRVANKNNLLLTGHKGRQFTADMAMEYDLILAMDKFHLEQISKIAPEARGKTMLFGHWLNMKEIPDPYRKSDEAFDSVYKLIELASKSWATRLER